MNITISEEDVALIALEYVKSAFDVPVAYLHVTYHLTDNKSDPLDIELFWDEEGFGKLAKLNLRDEYLDIFANAPERYADKMPAVVAALRKLADDIEALQK